MNGYRVMAIRFRSKELKVWIAPPVEHLQSFWARGYFYELRMLEHIMDHHRGGVFVDVGSSIGNHTLFFAAFCEPKLVVSVEPVKTSLEQQRRSLILNALDDRVLLLNLALSNQPGSARMERFGENLGQFRISEGLEILVSTLDSLVQEHNLEGIKLLKIDVEGWELEVLEGAVRTLKRDHPSIFVEIFREGNHPKISKLLGNMEYTERDRWGRVFEFV